MGGNCTSSCLAQQNKNDDKQLERKSKKNQKMKRKGTLTKELLNVTDTTDDSLQTPTQQSIKLFQQTKVEENSENSIQINESDKKQLQLKTLFQEKQNYKNELELHNQVKETEKLNIQDQNNDFEKLQSQYQENSQQKETIKRSINNNIAEYQQINVEDTFSFNDLQRQLTKELKNSQTQPIGRLTQSQKEKEQQSQRHSENDLEFQQNDLSWPATSKTQMKGFNQTLSRRVTETQAKQESDGDQASSKQITIQKSEFQIDLDNVKSVQSKSQTEEEESIRIVRIGSLSEQQDKIFVVEYKQEDQINDIELDFDNFKIQKVESEVIVPFSKIQMQPQQQRQNTIMIKKSINHLTNNDQQIQTNINLSKPIEIDDDDLSSQVVRQVQSVLGSEQSSQFFKINQQIPDDSTSIGGESQFVRIQDGRSERSATSYIQRIRDDQSQSSEGSQMIRVPDKLRDDQSQSSGGSYMIRVPNKFADDQSQSSGGSYMIRVDNDTSSQYTTTIMNQNADIQSQGTYLGFPQKNGSVYEMMSNGSSQMIKKPKNQQDEDSDDSFEVNRHSEMMRTGSISSSVNFMQIGQKAYE